MLQLDASPIRRLITTDTIETQAEAFCDKVRVVSVAPLFAEAIRRIHYRESISVLFEDRSRLRAAIRESTESFADDR